MRVPDGSQLSLALGLPPQASRDTVFFAALPPPEVADAIAACGRQLLAGQRYRIDWRPARVLHVSLAGVGLWDGLSPDGLRHVRRVGAGLEVPAISVRLVQALSFGKARRRTLVLVCEPSCIPPLAALARTLRRGAGGGRLLARRARRFHAASHDCVCRWRFRSHSSRTRPGLGGSRCRTGAQPPWRGAIR